MLRFHCTDNGPAEDRMRFVQSFAQTCETAQMYRSRILIAPPTSAYTQYKYAFVGSPPTHVRAAILADICVRMRSNTKLSAGLKRSRLRGGHVPPVLGSPLALDPLVVMAVISNNE